MTTPIQHTADFTDVNLDMPRRLIMRDGQIIDIKTLESPRFDSDIWPDGSEMCVLLRQDLIKLFKAARRQTE